jgi:hypothetical protein
MCSRCTSVLSVNASRMTSRAPSQVSTPSNPSNSDSFKKLDHLKYLFFSEAIKLFMNDALNK